ncbi:SixA phosphatase family protein [Amycolatopsis nigrescens]|uniref:SixA phosphatase family protein n=1 Tax=Amycolatopsis nigrescens TaxID=381445 RepID=UPI00036B7081|nr:histidine phosphatase family protein [Amycolatopsis nigrescens]
MTRTLVLLRHAKSAWPQDVPDFERPLGDRGRRDAPAAGRWLREHVGPFDLVVCSSAARARQTWGLVSAEFDPVPEALTAQRLYGASPGELVAVARELPEQARTVLFIGHNPGLEELVALLSGTPVTLKTSSTAVLAGTAPWRDIAGGWASLDAFATPRG